LLARSAGSDFDVEEFSLPHGGDAGMSQAVERAANGLALRIEHGRLEGNVYASLHVTTLQDLETAVERGRIPPSGGTGGADRRSARERQNQA